jgi:hypothetical protein
MNRPCVTHHHACDCREAEFAAVVAERDRAHDILDIVIGSVGSAIVRAGLEPVDDPGEAIDIIAAERDALQARIDASPIVKRSQLRSGIVPGDYSVPSDWNPDGKFVALVVVE